jgi:hypothetical protein
MIPTNELDEAVFQACSAEPMQDVSADTEAVLNIWPYVDAIPADQLRGVTLRDVQHVYRDGADRYDQVLIATDWYQVFMVIVIDRATGTIYGHHYLDLPALYRTEGYQLDG